MKNPKKPRRRILRKLISFLLVLIVLAGAGMYLYSMLRAEYTVTYDSYTAITGSISNALSFSGSLSLVNSKNYSASSAATVRTLYVGAGDDVQEGDKLARLSNGETLTADFDGRINTVSVKEGDEVNAGGAILQLVDFTHMQVSLRVDEYDIADVSVGQACTVTATATEKSFSSQIDSINYISSSAGSVAYYTAVAYVDVTEGVYPGMQVSISIPQEEATDVVILKADALSFDATNQAYVWMKNDAGELEQVYVETGVSNGNYVEIVSGLADGDEVFVEVKETAANAVTGLLSGLFGGQQFNAGMSGGRGGMSGDMDFSSFGGEMPDMSSMGGGMSENSGGRGGMSGGGGGMPGGGN